VKVVVAVENSNSAASWVIKCIVASDKAGKQDGLLAQAS